MKYYPSSIGSIIRHYKITIRISMNLDLLKVIFTFYHGKSPLNHHLGNMFYLFRTSKKQIQMNQLGFHGMSGFRSNVAQVSNEKKSWLFRVFFRDEILPSYMGDYFINHEIRIPSLNSQYSWKVSEGFVGTLLRWHCGIGMRRLKQWT